MKSMNEDITRRNFLCKALIGLGAILVALIGIPVSGFVLSPVFRKKEQRWVSVAWEEDLKLDGLQELRYSIIKQDAWLKVNAKKSAYILRKEGNDYVVVSSVCTHLGCSVHLNSQKNEFMCPCHGGRFDTNGNVLGGPPSKPLIHLKTKVENGRLFIQDT
jgi:menaquinol-cytochrome c reductase iron-sulfur subunit